jgi:hypothetical protein
LGKTGGTILLGIDVRNASSTTSCTGSLVKASGNTPFIVSTGGASSYYIPQPLSVTERTKIIVSCQTDGKVGSDSVDAIIKSENEF